MAFMEYKSSLLDSVNCAELFHVLDFRTVSKFLLYDVIMKKVHTYELSHQILQEKLLQYLKSTGTSFISLQAKN